jgi:hypothetical protein
MNAPSSRPPAGVPDSGGNAKYAIVAILLLLAAGGIFAWRNFTNRNETPAPMPTMSVAQSATPPPNPKLDDVPLPPPPEEKPEAGPPKIVYVQAGGCDATCKGAATPELEQAIKVRGMQARRCYNQALASDSSLKGHVTVAVKIGPAGNVCSASVAANDMASPGVANCAANIFRSAGGYPAPRGGCIDANVPLSFVPQGGGQ